LTANQIIAAVGVAIKRRGLPIKIKSLENKVKKSYEQKVQDAIKRGWGVCFSCATHTTLYRYGKAKRIKAGE
jgi:hypothetical protein